MQVAAALVFASVFTSVFASVFASALTLTGCRAEKGSGFRCSCTSLTDFDDALTVRVDVCETSVDEARGRAKGCAQSVAPAPVQDCACVASSEAARSGCHVGDCDSVYGR